ncbi:PAS domain S-box protein [Methylomonas rivi]|uniref:PAS domain S-box protein n=1 Tax=Methylomonas rivi TaxID=2952226 RepID=A0ABT1U1L2_9GAMM|nr:PAS domain S-box protein [Methylomonas sp. WSC-6]MBS4052157.1 PAS domain S-box protein [Methylomonas sp.]MCQ8127717.1 PAS domain S-box protein [Methylomonas sp. WSC-6]
MEKNTPKSRHKHIAVQKPEAWYQAIIESSNDAVIGKGLDGLVASWNPAAERIFGYREAEMLGQPITKLIPEERHGEEKIILGRILQGDHIQHYETIRIRKNGAYFPACISLSPIRNNAGKIVGAAKIIRDVTERKVEELLSKDNRFRVLFETIVDAVVIINTKGTIQALNPAAFTLLGYQPIEVQGQNVSILIPEPHTNEHDTYLNNYLKTGVKKLIGIGREAVCKRKDGSIFPVELTISEMNVDGERMFAGVIRDITLRKRCEAEHDFEQQLASELLQILWETEKIVQPGLTLWRGEGLPGKRYFSGDLLLQASCHGQTYILHADSMGHGLVAALPLLPLGDTFYALARSGHTIEAIAASLNRLLFERIPRGCFVSASILRINPDHRIIECWCGAMPPIVALNEGGALVTQIHAEHPALGVIAPNEFDARAIHWRWDDQQSRYLFLYSDGLTDAQNSRGESFGMQRALALFTAQLENRNPTEERYKTFIDFVDPNRAQDDVSLMMIDCTALRP